MTSTTREAPPAEDDDRGWVNEVLHESPRLRPLRRWVSEQSVHSHAVRFLPPLALTLSYALSTPGRRGLGAVMFLAVALAVIGLTSLARRLARQRRSAACERSPNERWRHDRMWDERGETRSWFARMPILDDSDHHLFGRLARVLLILVGSVFLVGRQWWIGTALLGIAATWMAFIAWRIHGAGDAHLAYAQFPFHAGERVALRFGMSSGGAQFIHVRFRLFHVSEYWGGSAIGRSLGVRVSRAMSERRPPGTVPGPDLDVEVSFDVPADAPGTRLTDDLPAYWVLEVRGVTTAGRYVERFLVPIYERPGSPADEPPPA